IERIATAATSCCRLPGPCLRARLRAERHGLPAHNPFNPLPESADSRRPTQHFNRDWRPRVGATLSPTDWQMLAPTLALVVAAMVVLVADVVLPWGQRIWLPWVALFGVVAAGAFLLPLRGRVMTGFSGFLISDDLAVALGA